MLVIAHRGASAYEPENTLRAIRRALEVGADGIEIDVYCIEDELIVIHDETVDRTTNGHGLIRRHTVGELRALDAGRGELIPFLSEALDLIDRRTLVNIELKGPNTAGPVHELLSRYISGCGWSAEDFLISSFDGGELCRFAGLGVGKSAIPVGLLLTRAPEIGRALPAALAGCSLHVPLARVTESVVARAHANGQRLFVYTVNDQADMNRMARLGVDAIFTDYPDRRPAL